MKITQIMLAKGFGGAERHFVDLSLALADKGYRVQAICHTRFAHRSELAKHPNIVVQPVQVLATWDVLARFKIKRMIASFQPQIIHAHLARGAFIGGKAAQTLGIPAVVNLHNYIDLKYYRNIDVFIPATVDQKNYLLSHGVPAGHITHMPHFSLLAAQPIQPLPTDKPLRFITLGRLVKKKGFDVLLRAFRSYLDSAGVAEAGQLIIGGDGTERDALKNLAIQLSLQDHVTFSGWIEDAASFLQQGDVFVLPSLDEPFGIVILEAMASGKPIISTRTQGPVEILDDASAYFAEIGDVQTLTQAMLAVHAAPKQAAQKAQAATALFQSTYSAAAVVPQVEAIYQRLARQL